MILNENEGFKLLFLNNFVRDLDLQKEKSKLLGLRLKEKNMFAAGMPIHVLKRREQQYGNFFNEGQDIVCCFIKNSVAGIRLLILINS